MFQRERYRGVDETVQRVYKYPKGRNIIFTHVEKLENMTIFHGRSRKKVSDKDLRQIEQVCTESSGGNNVTASLEKDDPYLFKIVTWKANS